MTHSHAVVAKQQAAPFSPSDIAGMKLWLKADAIVGADNDVLASWTDSGPDGVTVSQSTESKRPVLKTGIIGGKPVVRFDNTDDQFDTNMTLAQPMTVFAVFAVNETGTWGPFGGGGGIFLYGETLSQPIMLASGGVGMNVGGAIIQSTPYVFACRFNGTVNSKGNRSDSGTTSTGNAGTGGWVSGTTRIGSTNDRFGCDLAELVVYNSALSGANVDLVGGYLATKYSLTWTGGAT